MSKFKVGDKVRLTKDNGGGEFGSKGDEGVVRSGPDTNGDYSMTFTTGTEAGDYWFVAPDGIELATLTIEAGKFYKTRDGRKVGPMTKSDGRWYVRGALGTWNDDGTASNHHKPTATEFGDLIAEWVAEPAVHSATPAAVANDNAAAKPKFKVGDRVRIVRARLSHKKPHIGDEFVIQRETYKVDGEKTWGGEGAHGCVWLESELELAPSTLAIVALIENGQPKPATKPKIHADQASATTEAERLALQFPGQQFGVFVLADSKIADVVNVPTAVLRAA